MSPYEALLGEKAGARKWNTNLPEGFLDDIYCIEELAQKLIAENSAIIACIHSSVVNSLYKIYS